jgi:hypothetical protein
LTHPPEQQSDDDEHVSPADLQHLPAAQESPRQQPPRAHDPPSGEQHLPEVQGTPSQHSDELPQDQPGSAHAMHVPLAHRPEQQSCVS